MAPIMNKPTLFLLLFLIANFTYAQVGIGTTNPDPNAQLELSSTDKGLLMPRMALTATNSPAPLTAHVEGMTVYNTATSAPGPNQVTPGFYINDGNKWVKTSSEGWTLSGNAGTNSSNFLGTTDNVPIRFKVNNLSSGIIDPIGKNSFYGYQAGASGSGSLNVGMGENVLKNNTSGGNDVAVGYNALLYNTTGSHTVAIGANALKSNTTGGGNTAVGSENLENNSSGSNNTAVGFKSMKSNTTGSSNIAMGNSALSNNTSGTGNTALGNAALSSNTIGTSNTAIGGGALANATATGNTSVGYNSSGLNTTGGQNTAVGYNLFFKNTTGSFNSAYGASALYNNTIGGGNVAVGGSALIDNITGSNNTGIGYLSKVGAGNLNNATAIGYKAEVNANNSLVLGSIAPAVNVGIGVSTPAHALHIVAAANPLRMEGLQNAATTENFLTVDASGVVHRSTNTVGRMDTSEDGWINDVATSSIKLFTTSDGITTRSSSNMVAISDGGYMTIGSSTLDPSNKGLLIIGRELAGTVNPPRYILNASATPTSSNEFSIYKGSGASTFSGSKVYGLNLDLSGGSGSNHYGLYIVGEDKNYFSGAVGIGTNVTTNTLHVVAAADPIRMEGLQSGDSGNKILTVAGNGVVKKANATGAVQMPVGTTAERPTAPQFGMIRYNSDIGRGEMYVNDVNGDGTLGDAGWRPI